MIEEAMYRKKVKILDVNGKEWVSIVEDIISALDSDSGEREVLIKCYGGLVEFKESEIKSIEIVSGK